MIPLVDTLVDFTTPEGLVIIKDLMEKLNPFTVHFAIELSERPEDFILNILEITKSKCINEKTIRKFIAEHCTGDSPFKVQNDIYVELKVLLKFMYFS